jgi:molybdopterin-guanine dinucleotide biosynthesis protein A
MGRDKATLIAEGTTLSVRAGALLERVVDVAVEVGPGVSGLRATWEEPRGEGPLAAVAAGWDVLGGRCHLGSALVLACDLPFVSEALLRLLATWDSIGSVVPVVRGTPQPLCARWGHDDLDDAARLVHAGERSLQHLALMPGVVLLAESAWSGVAEEREFADVDSPSDLRRLGLWPSSPPGTRSGRPRA